MLLAVPFSPGSLPPLPKDLRLESLMVRDPFATWLFQKGLPPSSSPPSAVVVVVGELPPLLDERQETFLAFKAWAIRHLGEAKGVTPNFAPPLTSAQPPHRYGGNPVPGLAPMSI